MALLDSFDFSSGLDGNPVANPVSTVPASTAPVTANSGASLWDKLTGAVASVLPVAVSAWSKNQETEAELAQYKAAGQATPVKKTTSTQGPGTGTGAAPSGFTLSPTVIIGGVLALGLILALVIFGRGKK